VRFGVADSDWFTVLLISCTGYLLPVPFGITVFYVPLQMWTWLLVTAGSIAFFNYIRIGRRPRWLPHRVKALFFHHRHCRSIPNGKGRAFTRPWIIDSNVADQSESQHAQAAAPIQCLIEHNSQFQEACEEKWNTLLLTTN
jgi:hypothetical protein